MIRGDRRSGDCIRPPGPAPVQLSQQSSNSSGTVRLGDPANIPREVHMVSSVRGPDAVAATAVLRLLLPPHRLLTILEGESLLNDASALLIYRLAVGSIAARSFALEGVVPTFLLGVLGSLIAGPALGWITQRV